MAALDASTGTLIWNTPLNPSNFQFGSSVAIEDKPVISDSSVYIVVVGQGASQVDNPNLCCLDKNTGAVRWTHDLVAGSYTTETIYSTPVIVNNKVVAIGHWSDPIVPTNTIYCFDKNTGAQIWNNNSLFTSPPYYINSYPVSPDTSQILFISDHSDIISLDANTGTELWTTKFPIGAPRNVTPIINDGHLYLYDGLNFMDFNLATRQPANVFKDSMATETILGNMAYTVDFYNSYTNRIHTLAARPINNYSHPNWTWVSPTGALFDSAQLSPKYNSGYFNFCYFSNLTTDGKVVYYYENFYDEFTFDIPASQQLNALFMLDANTGTLLKEVKLSTRPLGDSLAGRNLIVVKNKKAYYPF